MTSTTSLITGPELCRLLRTSRTVFYGLRARGKIGPKPLTGLGLPRWNAAEVEAWLLNPDERGELYDAARWPAVWKSLKGRA